MLQATTYTSTGTLVCLDLLKNTSAGGICPEQISSRTSLSHDTHHVCDSRPPYGPFSICQSHLSTGTSCLAPNRQSLRRQSEVTVRYCCALLALKPKADNDAFVGAWSTKAASCDICRNDVMFQTVQDAFNAAIAYSSNHGRFSKSARHKFTFQGSCAKSKFLIWGVDTPELNET